MHIEIKLKIQLKKSNQHHVSYNHNIFMAPRCDKKL